jgi:hypothetical protein
MKKRYFLVRKWKQQYKWTSHVVYFQLCSLLDTVCSLSVLLEVQLANLTNL